MTCSWRWSRLQLEEVVVDADALDAEHLGPDGSELPLDLVTRSDEGLGQLGTGVGAGRALRSTLPWLVRGRASRCTKAEGTMYSGSRP
jgi:hypothetical protein